MSEIVDELLKEVEELESATEELEHSTKNVQQQKQTLQDAQDKAMAEPELIALQTAKTAQDAAKQSHQAAQAAIRQAENLKAQVLELNESNFNWRQGVRHAANDFKKAKSTFTTMLITSILFSSIALGAAGYFMYVMKKQNDQLKGEVMDLLANENALLKKAINLKMDEMASVIENINHPANLAVINETVKPPLTEPDKIAASEQEKTTVAPDIAANPAAAMPADSAAESIDHSQAMNSEEQQQLLETVAWLKENSLVKADLDSLHKQIEALQKQLDALPQVSQNAQLSKADTKKLDSLSWLVRKQSKQLETIASKVESVEKTTPSNDLIKELQLIKAEQKIMQTKLVNIQKTIDLLSELAKEPPPYSYKAK